MKRILAGILVSGIIMASALSAGAAEQTEDKPTLMARGMEMIDRLDKLAECSKYAEVSGMTEEIVMIIDKVAEGDYSSPRKVYVIDNAADAMWDMFAGEKSYPDVVMNAFKRRAMSSIPSMLNALEGVVMTAAASCISDRGAFVDESILKPCAYIYTFDNNLSFFVSFFPEEDGAVLEEVQLIGNKEFYMCSDADEVEEYLADNGMTGMNVEEAEPDRQGVCDTPTGPAETWNRPLTAQVIKTIRVYNMDELQ